MAPLTRAMVLAAGRGRRLRPQTDTLPKPLFPVAGRHVLCWILEYLGRYGVREVVINVSHLGDRIVDALGDELIFSDDRGRVRLAYSWEDEPLGAGGGLKKAEPLLCPDRSEGEDFLVMNGVILLDIDLTRLVETHQRAGAAATLVLRPDPAVERYGAVVVDPEGRVRDISGYVGAPARPDDRRYMFTGLQVLSSRVFDCLPEPVEEASQVVYPYSSTTADAFPAMIRAGEVICAIVHEGLWGKVETPESYAALCALVEARGIAQFIGVTAGPTGS